MADLADDRATDGSRLQSIDFGTRQWAPEDDLESARMDLHRRLDAQRARRTAAYPVESPREAARTAPAAPAPASRPVGVRNTQISISYAELLKIVAQAAINQRGVALTRTVDNVYLKLDDGEDAPTTGQEVGALIDLELAVRDRLEAVVARRYLEMQGLDHVVDDEVASLAEDPVVERIRA